MAQTETWLKMKSGVMRHKSGELFCAHYQTGWWAYNAKSKTAGPFKTQQRAQEEAEKLR